jgi:hypothetical protein
MAGPSKIVRESVLKESVELGETGKPHGMFSPRRRAAIVYFNNALAYNELQARHREMEKHSICVLPQNIFQRPALFSNRAGHPLEDVISDPLLPLILSLILLPLILSLVIRL